MSGMTLVTGSRLACVLACAGAALVLGACASDPMPASTGAAAEAAARPQGEQSCKRRPAATGSRLGRPERCDDAPIKSGG